MEIVPRKLNELELWWWALPSMARWFVGSLSIATFAGILGGVLA